MRLATISFPDGDLDSAVDAYGHWVRSSVLCVPPGGGLNQEHIDDLTKQVATLSHSEVTKVLRRGDAIPDGQATLHNPLPQVGKIVAVGMNYLDHIAEVGAQAPQQPYVFGKYPSAITGPYDDVAIDYGLVSQPDYEVELGVVIGTAARDIAAEHALEVVAGYLVVNDLSSRNLQFSEPQWIRSKSFDGFCPVGPWLTTADAVPNPQDLTLWSHVNGEQRQMSTTGQMLFSVAELIAFCSRGTTLHPGDLILTGTPPGVAMGMAEPRWLKPGDLVECGIAGLGELHNRITARPDTQGQDPL